MHLKHFNLRALVVITAALFTGGQWLSAATNSGFSPIFSGELIQDKAGSRAISEGTYQDFALKLEYRSAVGSGGGIHLRGADQPSVLDLLETYEPASNILRRSTNRLSRNARRSSGGEPGIFSSHEAGEWKTLKIRLVGSRLWVWQNQTLVAEGLIYGDDASETAPLARSGPICLKASNGPVHWRKLSIREIDAEEANMILGEHASEGFEPIFNGKNFDGWLGDTGEYTIRNKSIISQAGGNIYTSDQYADFVFRMEFKLPPAGNNGLAIRYPGKGTPAYSGMCELQVLDNSAEKYAKLDPRQYHGSIYGKVAAERGYLRRQGLWNFQEVKVVGSRITVELNGTVILDADQSKVEDFMSDDFTNKIPESGHLGFAGHGKGVAFRNLSIKEL